MTRHQNTNWPRDQQPRTKWERLHDLDVGDIFTTSEGTFRVMLVGAHTIWAENLTGQQQQNNLEQDTQ